MFQYIENTYEIKQTRPVSLKRKYHEMVFRKENLSLAKNPSGILANIILSVRFLPRFPRRIFHRACSCA